MSRRTITGKHQPRVGACLIGTQARFCTCEFKNGRTDAVIIRILTDVSAMLPSSGYTRLNTVNFLTVFGLVYPEEGSITETSVKILIITASVLPFLN